MDTSDPSALSRNVTRNDPRQVWMALAQAAQALQAAASAMLGEGFQPVATLSLLPPPDGLTVRELVNEFLRAKARAGRCDRYLRALRVSLDSFAKGRKNQHAGTVTVQDLEAWLDKHDWAPRTQRGYLSDVLFNGKQECGNKRGIHEC